MVLLPFPFTTGAEIGEQEVSDEHWYIGGRATFGGRKRSIETMVVGALGLFRTMDRWAVPRADAFVAVPATSFSMTTVTGFEELEFPTGRDVDVIDTVVDVTDLGFEALPGELVIIKEDVDCV